MTSSRTPVDRNKTAPFHVKVFYRTLAYLRTEELLTEPLPLHSQIFAWRDTTLKEIAEDLSFDELDILPNPFIGIRLEFRHVFQTPPGPNNQGGALTHRYIGSFVFGAGGPGASAEEGWDGISHDSKTLQDIRFVQGDMLICAIMPPDEESGGDVVRANTAKVGRGKGIGEAGGVTFDYLPSSSAYGHRTARPLGSEGRAAGPSGRGFKDPRNSYRPRRDNVPDQKWARGEIPDSQGRFEQSERWD
ncbi:Sin3 associated polypeptide p18-domain-containing protein [Rhypophila decipiens]|uniref:Sin3 associated polypeptide p18-domain-containing protein n=1 Tax=Rhypophila decipiens TaxID=261697 RepID=A0AAN6YAS0_9PEZI|nr:Sin3 associated polypeptide p18-domain-containing protein [Rhypophila decipiens]